MSRRVYLDHNASTPVHPEVVAAMLPFFEEVYGNPSSVHAFGRAARDAVDDARAGIARTYQIPRPFAHLTVLENVALPPMFGRVTLERPAAEREAKRWLEFTGLAAKARLRPDALNLHQRKFL